MFPFSSALCAQQPLQYVGSTAATTDGSGNVTFTLPPGTSVGDLLILNTNGHGGTPAGSAGGSWTSPGVVSYKKITSAGGAGVTGSSPNVEVLLVVVRGASALSGKVLLSVSGYPTMTLGGVTKTTAGLGEIWFVGSNGGNDGASGYTMTSPPNAISSARSGGTSGCVGGFVNLYPGGYVSGASASVTASGGSAGTSYNTSEAYELV